MKHKILAGTLAVILLFCPFVLGVIHAQEKTLKLAFITCARDAHFFIPVKKGMKDAAGMMGVQCHWLGTEGVDPEAQALLLREAVRDGYDGIAFNIIDPDAFDGVIQDAIDAGVPVVGFNVDDHDTPNPRFSSVNQRLYEAGKRLGAYVSPHIPEGSHVLLTKHDEGVSALDDRARGIRDALAVKNIKWQMLITGNDAVEGAGIVRKTILANPEIDLVLNTGQSDTEATGRALEALGKSTECWSAGFDLSLKTMQLIKDGFIHCTVDQQPYIQGFYPVIQLTQYLRYGIMPSDIDAGAAIVERSNVDQVMELVKQQYR